MAGTEETDFEVKAGLVARLRELADRIDAASIDEWTLDINQELWPLPPEGDAERWAASGRQTVTLAFVDAGARLAYYRALAGEE